MAISIYTTRYLPKHEQPPINPDQHCRIKTVLVFKDMSAKDAFKAHSAALDAGRRR